jgi:hypothetical protein
MGVMTMKMISKTSITSTIGVTLMLELTFFPSERTAIPMVWAPSLFDFYSGGFPALLDKIWRANSLNRWAEEV